jgi:hypothetical protein
MDDSEELYDCAVCDQKTSLRCGGCGELAFCSREHQKIVRLSPPLGGWRVGGADQYSLLQLWPTHKWLCGKDTTVFSLPPLTVDEATMVVQVHERTKSHSWNEEEDNQYESMPESFKVSRLLRSFSFSFLFD